MTHQRKGLDYEEPSLRDVMKMLGNITTKLATHEARMDNISSHMVVPVVVADVQPGPSRDTAKRGCPMVAIQDD